jgi:hypothetical protein
LFLRSQLSLQSYTPSEAASIGAALLADANWAGLPVSGIVRKNGLGTASLVG